MKSLHAYVLSLIFLFFNLPHRSFAFSEVQNSTSYDTHFLTVQEYCQFLINMASAEDRHGLYDPKTMGGEIVRCLSKEDPQPHFFYGIAHGVDPQSPMLGLTELDAMRCCNWIENFPLDSHSTLDSAEAGSYLLRDDDTFEKNDKGQLSLTPHNDGTFEIVSNVKKESTSPLMFMFPCLKGSGNERKTSSGLELTSSKKKRYYQLEDSPTENHIGLSLSQILCNPNNDRDNALIGYVANNDNEDQIKRYIFIEDISFYGIRIPDLVKSCLISKKIYQQLQEGGQKIRAEVLTLIKKTASFHKEQKNSYYKSHIGDALFTLVEPVLEGIDWTKIQPIMREFDQSFNMYNLTRKNLEAFLVKHKIAVPPSEQEEDFCRSFRQPSRQSSSSSRANSLIFHEAIFGSSRSYSGGGE